MKILNCNEELRVVTQLVSHDCVSNDEVNCCYKVIPMRFIGVSVSVVQSKLLSPSPSYCSIHSMALVSIAYTVTGQSSCVGSRSSVRMNSLVGFE